MSQSRHGAITAIHIGLTAVVGIVLYTNTLRVPFIFDDQRNIIGNRHVHLQRFSLNGLVDAGFASPDPMRPVAYITFALNYLCHGHDVVGYHVVNVAIHVVTGVLIYLLAATTFSLWAQFSIGAGGSLSRCPRPPTDLMALAASLLFVTHPLATQSVTYVVQRMNSLAAMFSILSLLLYVRGRLGPGGWRRGTVWGLAALSWVTALGCKQIAATVPLTILLYEGCILAVRDRLLPRRRLVLLFGLAGAGVLIAALLFGSRALTAIQEVYAHRDFTMGQRVLSQARVLVFYMSLILFPHPSRLNLLHDFEKSWSLIEPATTLAATGLIGVLIVWAAAGFRRHRLASFCILWFFGQLAIESSVFPLEMIYEHRLYLPMFAVSLGAPALLLWFPVGRFRTASALLLVAIVALGAGTVLRNETWRDPVEFWSDAAAKSPDSPRAHNNLGLALQRGKQFEEAIACYRRAVELSGENHTDPIQNLANVLASVGRFEEAIGNYGRILREQPDDAKTHYNLAKTLSMQGNLDAAETHYRVALRLEPNAETHHALAYLLRSKGNVPEAIAHYRLALQIDPRRAETQHNLGLILYRSGDIGKAIDLLAEAARITPDWSAPLNTQAWILATNQDAAVRDPARAVRLAGLACELSEHRSAHDLDTLAAALAAAGRFERAIDAARQALALSESDEQLAVGIRRRLELYERGEAYREVPGGG